MKYSLIIPVYRNEESIPRLLSVLADMNDRLQGEMEAVFVVDGSPDRSFELLRAGARELPLRAQVLAHSRNFGSFAAIRSGLAAARGDYFGVMAADLQEPPELLISFFRLLENDECDIVVGTRNARADPLLSRLAAHTFWSLYRRLVVPDMPEGGVDVFGCNLPFRNQLLELREARSSLIALIFWLGFRRKDVSYVRQVRAEGKSAWTFRKKVDYMLDSIFAFTDYPIRVLTWIGTIGVCGAVSLSLLVAIARGLGTINVPGYAATMLVVLGLGAANLLGLGVVGTYAWRAYENSKQRPLSLVAMRYSNDHTEQGGADGKRSTSDHRCLGSGASPGPYPPLRNGVT